MEIDHGSLKKVSKSFLFPPPTGGDEETQDGWGKRFPSGNFVSIIKSLPNLKFGFQKFPCLFPGNLITQISIKVSFFHTAITGMVLSMTRNGNQVYVSVGVGGGNGAEQEANLA